MLTDQEVIALGKKLVDAGLLTSDRLSDASRKANEKGVVLPRFLVDSGIIPKSKVYETLAEIFSVPYVDVSNFQISPEAIQCISADLANRYKAIPLFKIGNTLNIAMENPSDVSALQHLAQKSRCEIDVCLGASSDIDSALKEHYGAGNFVNQLLKSLSAERKIRTKSDGKNLQSVRSRDAAAYTSASSEHPVIRLVDLIIRQAFDEGASDIHIEPEEKMLRIRYRVDGVLHEASQPAKELESEIISRIKVLAEMDIAETRVPQDGRIKTSLSGKDVDMRVSTMPTVYGENIVIRILKDSTEVLDLTSLGLSDEMRKTFEELIHRPYGMLLETGPTGSGKTTTLYAALSMINSVERNIVTVEDPVEYKLPMIRQIQVNTKAGLNFANALRSILRQDPDVIMVGEIRDRETAEIAVQSALTGHLVFSTLHANSAAGVVSRLADMKIEPFLIASSVIGVISQRLVRQICEKCKAPDTPSEVLMKVLKVSDLKSFKAFKGTGCRHCRNTGYKGRVGIFEMVKITEEIQNKILKNASTSEIEQEARKLGFKGLRDDGLDKIAAGLTTVEEVVKAVDLG